MIFGSLRDDFAVLIGEIEQLIEDFGRKMKGRVGENFVRLGRQSKFQKILFDDTDVLDVIFLEIGAKFFGSLMIGLDGPDCADAFREGDSNNTRTGADIENEVAFLEVAMADELQSETGRPEEVL